MTHILFFKNIFFIILIHILLAVFLVNGYGQDEGEPEFLAPLKNLTVTQGRDVSFACVVNNLGQYRVAWIKSDSKVILAKHTHMVSLNSRLSVTHNGHNTWKLHIWQVHLNDSGSYMCQVNTDPMRNQSGYLDVVVPPDILDDPDSNGTTNENGTIQLVCKATGVPKPSVIWKREGGTDIVLRNEGQETQMVNQVEGEKLVMHQVQRTDMVSPSVKVLYQLVAAPVESNALLQCIVEVFPQPLNLWYKTDGVKPNEATKYVISQSVTNSYVWHLNLTIKNLQKHDFDTYICSSANALGKSDGRIRLHELRLPPKPTTTVTPDGLTTVEPRKKPHQTHNNKDDTPLREEQLIPNQLQIIANIGPFEVPVRAGVEETCITQTTPPPSQRPPA